MDRTVFGPYYGIPPENRTQPSRTEEAFARPVTPVRRGLRFVIRARRKAHNTTPRNRQ